MKKELEEAARAITLNRGRRVARGDVYDGGMDDGIVVLDAGTVRAICVRVNSGGLRQVRISTDRLRRGYKLLGENDAAAVTRLMQRLLTKARR